MMIRDSTCSQHHCDRSDCPPGSRHVRTLRITDGLWTAAGDAAGAVRTDVNTWVTQAIEEKLAREERAMAPGWLHAFDNEDFAVFCAEIRSAAMTGDRTEVDTCLRDWMRTAQALSDPQRREILTGPVAEEDFTEVPRP